MKRRWSLVTTWLILAVALAACSGDDPFCPGNQPVRTVLAGYVIINTQAGVDGLRGIVRVAGDLSLTGGTIVDLSPLDDLRFVEGKLSLSGLRNVMDYDPLQGLIQVDRLAIADCLQLTSLAVFSDVDSCQSFQVRNCAYVEDLPEAEFFTTVTDLDLVGLDRLSSLETISSATGLRYLQLQKLPVGLEYDLVSGFPDLVDLDLMSLPVTKLPELGALTELRWLSLRDLDILESFAGLQDASVSWLNVSGCGNITSLALLADCRGLRTIDLLYMTNLASLDGLANLPEIHRVNVQDCPLLADLSGLAALPSLDTVSLNRVPSLTDLSSLVGSPALVNLNIRDCSSLTSLAGPSLRPGSQLDINDCASLTSLAGLALPDTMYRLDLQDTAILGLQEMASVQVIRYLDLRRTLLESLAGLESIHWVRNTVSIRDNPYLTDVGALATIDSVGYGVTFRDNHLLDTCDLEAMIGQWQVDGIITIEDNGLCAD